MKIVFLLLSAIIILIFSIFSFTSYAEDSQADENSLLAYFDFETDTFQGWSSLGNKSKLSIDNKKSHSGISCISTSSRAESWSGPSLNITDIVSIGTEINLQAYVISEYDDTEIKMSVKYIDSSGTENYSDIGALTAKSNEWKLIESTYDIPDDTVELIIYFQTTDVSTDFSIDDISIYGIREHQYSSEYDGNDLQEYNFDFENGLDGWIPRGDISITRSAESSYSGKYSLFVSGRKEFWNAPMVRLKNIDPNVVYNYSAYVMYNGIYYGDKHDFSIKLQYTLNGKEVYSDIASKELQKGTWSKISGNFSIPNGAEDVFFYVQTSDPYTVTADDLMSFYIDNIAIFDNTAMEKQKMIKSIVIVSAIALGSIIICFIIIKIYRKIKHTQAVLLSASMDAMTKTFNRNTYEENLETLQSSPEKCKKVYLTICDLNFLKYINDNYGHEAGDRAIIRCAEVLLKTVGKKGRVYRTGGDEFMCITKSDLTNSIKNEFSIEASSYKGYPFSAAVGTAHYDSDIDFDVPDIKAIIKRSDAEMYKHKQEVKKFIHELSSDEFFKEKNKNLPL